jgi:hypothetical protein
MAWLDGCPTSGLFLFGNDDWRVSARASLGLPLFPALPAALANAGISNCPCHLHTPLTADFGYHFIVCPKSRFKHACHKLLKSTWRSLFESVELVVEHHEPEVGGLASADPDHSGDAQIVSSKRLDLLVYNWGANNYSGAFDVTVADVHCSSNCRQAVNKSLLPSREAIKDKKYADDCRAQGWLCETLAMDTAGKWGAGSHRAFRNVIDRMPPVSSATPELKPSNLVHYWRRRFSCDVRRTLAWSAIARFKAIFARRQPSSGFSPSSSEDFPVAGPTVSELLRVE